MTSSPRIPTPSLLQYLRAPRARNSWTTKRAGTPNHPSIIASKKVALMNKKERVGGDAASGTAWGWEQEGEVRGGLRERRPIPEHPGAPQLGQNPVELRGQSLPDRTCGGPEVGKEAPAGAACLVQPLAHINA